MWRVPLTILLFLLTLGCSTGHEKKDEMKGVATVNQSVVSPSGNYLLVIQEQRDSGKGVMVNYFQIEKITELKNGDNEIVYTSNDLYRTRDTLFFLWGENDQVWVYSGDLGTFYYSSYEDNKWVKHPYSENKSEKAPALLTTLKPEYFNNLE